MWIIRDLLSLVATDDPLEVRVGRNGTYIDGLSEWPIRCIEEAVSLMTRAANNRAVGHADPDLHCTRSHLVHLIKVRNEVECYHTYCLLLLHVHHFGDHNMSCMVLTFSSNIRCND